VIEVETGESVNHLEALALMAHLPGFGSNSICMVPAGMVDVAVGCRGQQIHESTKSELYNGWRPGRFTLVHRAVRRPCIACPPAGGGNGASRRAKPARDRQSPPGGRPSR